MSMLVARFPCGCVASALLSDDHDLEAEFEADALNDGLMVAREDRDQISAERCETHEREREIRGEGR